MARDRILVVDDDVRIVRALSRILEDEGYEVVGHDDPARALDERDLAVILTDFMMPSMDGIEMLAELRKTNPHAVRLLLTAASDFKTAIEAVNSGEVYRLLAKP